MRNAHRVPQNRSVAAAFSLILAMSLGASGCSKPGVSSSQPEGVPQSAGPAVTSAPAAPTADTVELREPQLEALKLAIIGTQTFRVQRTSVGIIDFDQNAAVQVFSPYPGRIIHAFADVGDDVRRGQPLYTVDSPDLLQAESALVTAAGQADLTKAALARAKDLYEHEGMAQKDYQQAVSDQMSAEGDLRAARDAVRIFGKTGAQTDTIIARRKIDSTLTIMSPVAGRVTARAAQPGLYVQPGSAPAPMVVANLSTLWMLASVPEHEIEQVRVGDAVNARVSALDNGEFTGTVKTVGESSDPATHTVTVRSELHDPDHRLHPGMMATYVIQTAAPVEGVAIPSAGVVREGDGTMSVWVTTDRRKFTRRTVTIGLQQDGVDQIVSGLAAGETAVVQGAILLSNILFGGGGDG